jgi:hypothetical protein
MSASQGDYVGYDANYYPSSPTKSTGYADQLPELYSGDPDAITVHRRKMMRRAANRRSAQLSRARKKSHMQELQAENSRLHRLLDIFDCQPDYTFCATSDGTVTFVNDRLACLNFNTSGGGAYPHEEDDPHSMKSKNGNVSHVSEILDQRSVGVLMDMISSLNRSSSSGNNSNSTSQYSKIHNGHTDAVPSEPIEVYLNQTEPALSEGLTCGYLRVSRVLRKPCHLVDDTSISASNSPRTSNHHNNSTDSKAPAMKKIKIGEDQNTFISAQSLEDAAAVLSALTGLATGSAGMQQETALKVLEDNVKEEEDVNSKNSSASNSSNNIAGQNKSSDGLGSGSGGDSKMRRPQRSTSATSIINDYVTSTQKSSKGNSSNGGSVVDNDSVSNISTDAITDEEYVCVIRPLKYTFPYELETKTYPYHLSKASMSAHNAEIVKRDSRNTGTRKRSCSGSSETEYDNSSSSASSSGDVSGDSGSSGGNTTIATRMSIDDDSGNSS